jgi:cbb3-type cytochrome oxidase subunit 3
MLSFLGWVALGLLLIWYVKSMNLSRSKRLHLNYYNVYLLLDDEIRNSHKRNL